MPHGSRSAEWWSQPIRSLTPAILLFSLAGCYFHARFVEVYEEPPCDLAEERTRAVLADTDQIAESRGLSASRVGGTSSPKSRILASYHGNQDVTVTLTLSDAPPRLAAMVRDMRHSAETETTAALFAELQHALEQNLPGCEVKASGGRYRRSLFAP